MMDFETQIFGVKKTKTTTPLKFRWVSLSLFSAQDLCKCLVSQVESKKNSSNTIGRYNLMDKKNLTESIWAPFWGEGPKAIE